jgi:hypothetical protein
VAEALAGGVTVAGLTVHTGASTTVAVEVAWQLRSTGALNPLVVPTEMFEDDVPPGSTASGDSGAACSVNCADAVDGNASSRASRQNTAIPAYPLRSFRLDFICFDFIRLDFNGLDFNMKRFLFN